jgi:hypothetical protein
VADVGIICYGNNGTVCGRHADDSIYELTTISSFVRSAVRKVREVARTVRIRTRCLRYTRFRSAVLWAVTGHNPAACPRVILRISDGIPDASGSASSFHNSIVFL